MNLIVGSDEKTALTDTVIAMLKERGHNLILCGHLSTNQVSWPAVGRTVGEAVVNGQATQGIVFCWTGTGVSIAANKVPGVRAALCTDAETARGARRWNDANVLALSLRLLSEQVAREIFEAWFTTQPDDTAENRLCLADIAILEQKYHPNLS